MSTADVAWPWGIGKTRLAIQAATSQPAYFVDGLAFVALDPVVSLDFLAAAIGGALEIPFLGAEEPLSQLMH